MAEKIITSFNARDFTNGQLLDLGNEIVDFLIPNLPDEDFFLGELLDDLRFTVLDLGRALGKNVKANQIDEVQMLGERRDQVWDEIRTKIRTNHDGTSAEERQAVQFLREWIGSEASEISIGDFIQEIQGPDRDSRIGALQVLQLTANAEELIQADAYLEIAKREAEEMATQNSETPRLVPVKSDLTKYLRLLLKNLAYLAEKGRHPFIDISRTCSDLIEQRKEESRASRDRGRGLVATSEDIGVPA